MALDCYLKDQMGTTLYHYPIDESLHRSIFSRNFQPIAFPILARLKDYYNDHFIATNEIPILIAELQLLKPQLPEQLQHSVAELIDLVSDDRIDTIECYCD
ncbi:hypothetical protein GCM10010918_02460 [Paenibacillus radicis (ex Gao et al. 2016)]|uniref:Uncharacterized protein n=1 Tax=Paenibacillus radicis (ex Gao et al. 2016) TaxID=1737354 RepID=A0A917GPT4_9BACL|nr:hypothetical protein GCM10010918_02460 [Paenibacillus radicis (ex Gao et al. 2016)]